MKWLAALIAAVVKALLPWLARQSKPTAEDADPARDERDKLRAKVRKHWSTSKPTGEDGWRDQ